MTHFWGEEQMWYNLGRSGAVGYLGPQDRACTAPVLDLMSDLSRGTSLKDRMFVAVVAGVGRRRFACKDINCITRLSQAADRDPCLVNSSMTS